MSTEDNKEVENNVQEASTEQTEFEKKLAEKDAEIARISKEKENYKKGMLKAKGKLKDEEDETDEDEEDETIEQKLDRMLSQKLLDSELARASAEKDQLIKDALARNKELETAIKNRSQIANAETGVSSDSKFPTKDNTLTDDKIAKFKSMGWDDKKIARFKENLKRMS